MEGYNEHPFTTYVRTKTIFQHRLKDLKTYDAVKVYMYELKKLGLHGRDIYQLREEGQIWYDDNGMFKAIREGPVVPRLLEQTRKWKKVRQELSTLHLYMREQLNDVTINTPNDQLPAYFQAFMTHRDNDMDLFFSVDGFSGRVHTPVVNLKGEMRKDLRLNGDSLISLDVKQMQPLILAKILEERVGGNPFSSSVFGGDDVYLILLKFNDAITTRNEAKKFLFQLIFGKPMDDIGQMFTGDTKWVTWINDYKRKEEKQNPHSRDMHTNLAWLLQTQEVKIMTDVWLALAKRKIKFLTIHDAVLVRKRDRLVALSILNSELRRHFRKFEVTIDDY